MNKDKVKRLYSVLEQQNIITEIYFYKFFSKLNSEIFNDRSQVRIVSNLDYNNCINQFKSNSDLPNIKLPICAIKVLPPEELIGEFSSFRGGLDVQYEDEKGNYRSINTIPISNKLEFKIYCDYFSSIQYIFEALLLLRHTIFNIDYKTRDFKKPEDIIKFSIINDGKIKIDEYPSPDQRSGKSNPGYIYSMSWSMVRHSIVYRLPIDYAKLIEEVEVEIYQELDMKSKDLIEKISTKE